MKRGRIYQYMGENGAGKSTLMKCLFGAHIENAGEISIDGITEDLSLLLPPLASSGVAVLMCAVNDFGVAKLNLHAFIITLGTPANILRCFVYIY